MRSPTPLSAFPATRLEALTDGVFAIALTLLVLELRVEDAHGSLASALAHAWPSYLAYVLAFARIGNLWVLHTALFRTLVHAERPLLYWNLLFLGLVAAVPFPTALLAENLRSADGRVAAAVFGVLSTGCGAAFVGIVEYLARRPHLVEEGFGYLYSPSVRRRRGRIVALYAASVLPVAISPPAFVAVHLAVIVWGSIPLKPPPVP